VPGHDDYPASFDQREGDRRGARGARDHRTEDRARRLAAAIGLDAPPRGNGVADRFCDDKGNDLASLIVGKTRTSAIRAARSGCSCASRIQQSSWLVRSVFEPKSDPSDWLDKEVMDVDRARIQETDVDPAGSASSKCAATSRAIRISRCSTCPRAASRPIRRAGRHRRRDHGFTFDDVRPAKDFDFGDPAHTARVVTKTFDGLSVTVQIIQQGRRFLGDGFGGRRAR
jgi:hypothetical protein